MDTTVVNNEELDEMLSPEDQEKLRNTRVELDAKGKPMQIRYVPSSQKNKYSASRWDDYEINHIDGRVTHVELKEGRKGFSCGYPPKKDSDVSE